MLVKKDVVRQCVQVVIDQSAQTAQADMTMNTIFGAGPALSTTDFNHLPLSDHAWRPSHHFGGSAWRRLLRRRRGLWSLSRIKIESTLDVFTEVNYACSQINAARNGISNGCHA
jgi:hypothetical protein